ncbi:helix-turn-helix domain-containing protein [Bradyrhizobium centrosematis]|uniref:helix-turn-helix domain-containing protein n=1 Tax=Bradyrhizobium centrosematis TaxID=1300039 RepID=UPI0021676A58|nr:helix-turn-helix transcriptional regulator [Bradyrhizobium centrosematis]MCS3759340.1 DNA-binding Xre family transcriptional regulator [Bradyrhizobium centrosematis]MCS3772770.1 DNA-binding Xre family transcriptional regulator [Bradyrhizobium centrosematis]
MGTFWSFIASNFSHLPSTGVLLVAGLALFGLLALKTAGLILAVRLSRKAIERGFSVEVSAGRDFYFRTPGSQGGSIRKISIAKPQLSASGSRIKSLRRKRKYTLIALSAASRIPLPRLSALETGRAEPVAGDISAICRALHLSQEEAADLKRLAGLPVQARRGQND